MPALASAASAAAAAPFAVVGRVAAGSPAAEAGILPGDAVIALGSLRGTSITIDGSGAPIQIPAPRLEAVAAEVARSHGTALSVTVRRQGVDAPLTLSLTPHEWAGQGLLGCLLLPA